MRWEKIRTIARRHSHNPELMLLRRAMNDTDLHHDARQAKIAELRPRVSASYEQAHREAAALVAEAQASWREHMPSALQRKAARLKPAAAQWAQTVGATAPAGELLQTAKLIESEGDASAAYGLRVALSTRDDIADADQKAEIMKHLNQAGTKGWEDTFAELVATQRAFAELENAGELADAFEALIADPAPVMRRIYDSRNVEQNEAGDVRALSESEARQHLVAAGMIEGGA